MKTPLADQVIVIAGASERGRARTASTWTAARMRLGKIRGIVALAAPWAAAAIGYHGVTKRR